MLVCQTLRENEATRDLPVIIISGPVAMEIRIQALRRGADDFVTKPFSPRELILRIQNILRRVEREKILQRQLEGEKARLQRARSEDLRAHRGYQLLRKGIRDGVAHLLDAFNDAGGQGFLEAMARVLVQRWGEGPLAYFEPGPSGFAPVLTRGVAPGAEEKLRLSGSWEDFSGGLAEPVFLDALPQTPRFAEMREVFAAAGFRVLVPGTRGGRPVGLLALGERIDGSLPSLLDLDLARCTILMFDALRRREVEEGERLAALIRLTARALNCAQGEEHRRHSAAVAGLCRRMAALAGISDADTDRLRLAASVHGLARRGIGEGAVCGTPLEEELLESLASRRDPFLDLLVFQNEEWNGNGWPLGLALHAIPLGARILAVADAYCLARGEGQDHDAARRRIEKEAGLRFDPEIVRMLAETGPEGAGSAVAPASESAALEELP